MLRATAVWSGGVGTPYYTSLYFGGDTSGEANAAVAAMNALAADFQDAVTDALIFRTPDEVEVVDPITGDITGVFPTTGVASSMNNGGEELPWTTQGLVRLRTGQYVNGREIRGRVFMPGPCEVNNAFGQPVLAYTSYIQAAWDDFLLAAAGAGGLVVWSPTHGQAADVASCSVWTEWASLRSRRD